MLHHISLIPLINDLFFLAPINFIFYFFIVNDKIIKLNQNKSWS